MTLNLFKRMRNTESDVQKELLFLLEDAINSGCIDKLQYAQIKSDINIQYMPVKTTNNANNRIYYTQEQVLTILKSHLNVYDGIKDLSDHLKLMQQLFGDESSQFRNGSSYNKGFHKTLNKGEPNLGQSMPANWADGTLELLQERPVQFKNVLDACQAIYDATNNGNMLQIIQKWRVRI